MYEIFGSIGKIDNTDDFIKKIKKFSKKNNVIIQVFNADLIFGKNHIITSFNHALRSIERKKNTTKSLEMEIILYVSGERQLKLAIPKMGIKVGSNNIAFIIINKTNNNINNLKNLINDLLEYLSLKRCDDVLNGNKITLQKFGINKKELSTISKSNYEKLIIEKVALVDIIK